MELTGQYRSPRDASAGGHQRVVCDLQTHREWAARGESIRAASKPHPLATFFSHEQELTNFQYTHGGKWWARCSAQVWHEVSYLCDFWASPVPFNIERFS